MSLLTYLVPLALGAVAVILVMGVLNMMRGGPANRSQNLMRMRVLFQFCAIILLMTALYFAQKMG